MRVINQDFDKLFHSDEYAIASTDAKGAITRANHAFQRLTGYSLDELKNLAYQDITPEAWMIYENNMIIKHVFAQGHAHYQKEYICKSGEVIPIEIDVYLQEDAINSKRGIWAQVKKIDKLDEKYLAIKSLAN